MFDHLFDYKQSVRLRWLQVCINQLIYTSRQEHLNLEKWFDEIISELLFYSRYRLHNGQLKTTGDKQDVEFCCFTSCPHSSDSLSGVCDVVLARLCGRVSSDRTGVSECEFEFPTPWKSPSDKLRGALRLAGSSGNPAVTFPAFQKVSAQHSCQTCQRRS